ncbi:hypothetical protein N0036_08575 [Pseudomonas aeruginosa]|uniref:hypothetical protein n=1 Tax=Pseudomonas aeruginosa TaxID=287 RepID=UPI00053F1A03|nr:hypothetical protein [Pseudomonas aeruginosa]MCS7675691.1 hypothetical protein [Pseudomonas aeruginosa]MCS7904998.1 hypothetical protein [Pseudomonas aeruginosa]MCS9345761.1 hypothetical protein [Pseudomonas aeruginosa]MCS9358600.1 hypothetical protein [Pseudomonas aeruginosa]MCS9405855.1 hypothetical protein [Pseudomonas aeruginosa]
MSPVTTAQLMCPSDRAAWTKIYTEAHIAELIKISLSEFLQNPKFYLISAGQETAVACVMSGYKPLLPAQVQAAAKIQAQWDAEDKAATAAKGCL